MIPTYVIVVRVNEAVCLNAQCSGWHIVWLAHSRHIVNFSFPLFLLLDASAGG